MDSLLTLLQGPYERRKSSRQFSEWVKMAGGRVRGSARDKPKRAPAPEPLARTPSTDSPGAQSLPPRPQPQIPPRPVSQVSPPQRTLPTPGSSGTLRRTESGNMQTQQAQVAEAARVASPPPATPVIEIWPLRLIDFDDDDQFNVIYDLLRRYKLIVLPIY